MFRFQPQKVLAKSPNYHKNHGYAGVHEDPIFGRTVNSTRSSPTAWCSSRVGIHQETRRDLVGNERNSSSTATRNHSEGRFPTTKPCKEELTFLTSYVIRHLCIIVGNLTVPLLDTIPRAGTSIADIGKLPVCRSCVYRCVLRTVQASFSPCDRVLSLVRVDFLRRLREFLPRTARPKIDLVGSISEEGIEVWEKGLHYHLQHNTPDIVLTLYLPY